MKRSIVRQKSNGSLLAIGPLTYDDSNRSSDLTCRSVLKQKLRSIQADAFRPDVEYARHFFGDFQIGIEPDAHAVGGRHGTGLARRPEDAA